MHVDVIIGSRTTRTFRVQGDNNSAVDFEASGVVRIEFCAHGKVLSSDDEFVNFQGNEIEVMFGAFQLAHYTDVTPTVKFYQADDTFEAIELSVEGEPVFLSFQVC
jgi:hypothetical protein